MLTAAWMSLKSMLRQLDGFDLIRATTVGITAFLARYLILMKKILIRNMQMNFIPIRGKSEIKWKITLKMTMKVQSRERVEGGLVLGMV